LPATVGLHAGQQQLHQIPGIVGGECIAAVLRPHMAHADWMRADTKQAVELVIRNFGYLGLCRIVALPGTFQPLHVLVMLNIHFEH
jgi:hypothetical protein